MRSAVIKMSSSNVNPSLVGPTQEIVKNGTTETHDNSINEDDGVENMENGEGEESKKLERKLVRKVDLRLCTIAGILCSLNLLDSGVIS